MSAAPSQPTAAAPRQKTVKSGFGDQGDQPQRTVKKAAKKR